MNSPTKWHVHNDWHETEKGIWKAGERKQLIALSRLTALMNKEFYHAKAENVPKRLLNPKHKYTSVQVYLYM
jgi:hypothetical protein